MCSKSGGKCAISYSNAFMVPSKINYIYSEGNNIISHEVDQSILDVSRKILQNGDIPKLQVVEKEGNWFTLNNSQLDLCRRLEEDGKCSKVKVDVVPLSEVPRVVRGMMTLPVGNSKELLVVEAQSGSSDPSRTTTKGYERLDQSDGTEEKGPVSAESDGDETCTDESSDYLDSDSECDWSDGDNDSSAMDSSAAGSDDNKSTDDERECLL